MQIYEVTDQRFRKYGRVLDTPSLTGEVRKELAEQMEKTPLPADVVYEPSVESLEQTKAAEILKEEIFGELPIQVGYCNGNNYLLNALEYHRSSEINIAATNKWLIGHAEGGLPEGSFLGLKGKNISVK